MYVHLSQSKAPSPTRENRTVGRNNNQSIAQAGRREKRISLFFCFFCPNTTQTKPKPKGNGKVKKKRRDGHFVDAIQRNGDQHYRQAPSNNGRKFSWAHMYTHDRRGHKKVREGDEGKIASKSLAQKDKASKTKNKSSRFVWKKQLKFFLSLKKKFPNPTNDNERALSDMCPRHIVQFFCRKKEKVTTMIKGQNNRRSSSASPSFLSSPPEQTIAFPWVAQTLEHAQTRAIKAQKKWLQQ